MEVYNKHIKNSALFSRALSWSSSAEEVPFVVPKFHKLTHLQQRAHSEVRLMKQTSTVSAIDGLLPGQLSAVSAQNCRTASLGSLNPELYKQPDEGDLSEYPEGHVGRIWFSMEFEKDAEKLCVTIIKVRNIPSRDYVNPNARDPFVRLFALPDERRYWDTKQRRKTCNPNYGEGFAVGLAKDSLEDRFLKFVVYDVDSLKRHIPVCSVEYPLSDYARCMKRKLTLWRDLKQDSGEVTCQLGELHCSLSFNKSVDRLSLVIIEAKDLHCAGEEEPDTVARVSLTIGARTVKTKKTRVIRKCACPVFNEAFDFKIGQPKLDTACLSIQIMQLKPERQIGRLMLGGSVFSRGKQLDHWQEMIAKPKEIVQDWHYLTE